MMMRKRGVLWMQKCSIILAIAVMAIVVWLSYRGLSSANPEVTKSVVYLQKPAKQQKPWPEKQADINRPGRPVIHMVDRVAMQQEPWLEKQADINRPGLTPSIVHYLWCEDRKFRFIDFLSVLSAVKMLQPMKMVFHYTHLPQTDTYNSWFQEFKSTFAGLELQELSQKSCLSGNFARTAESLLSSMRGLLMSQNVILSGIPKDRLTSKVWISNNNTHGMVYDNEDFIETLNTELRQNLISGQKQNRGCVSVNDYNRHSNVIKCIFILDLIYPRDIMETQTPFAELARWLFYGKRSLAVARPDPSNLIPRISHYIRLQRKQQPMFQEEFSFNHYLSVLSALYVAGFERVYVHAEEEPVGQWWKLLEDENVTLVKLVRPDVVFGHRVSVVQHVSDIFRYMVLYKYGGAYQDFDVIWTSRVPDSLLAYPVVGGMEWSQADKDWPESFNLGVLLAHPQSPWLSRHLETHKDFRDNDWGYNPLRMSYRTYELYPEWMYPDRKLQVMCYLDICHPAWEEGYVRSMYDRRPTLPFNWQEVRAIHITGPKPHPSLVSLETLRSKKDMYTEIGRAVLVKSGRQQLLS